MLSIGRTLAIQEVEHLVPALALSCDLEALIRLGGI